jgi:hypothetical protein
MQPPASTQPVQPPPPAPASQVPDRPSQPGTQRPRIGAIGGVGFPRPLAIEAIVMVGGVLALGAEYGVMPTVTVDNVQAGLWSLAADARVFPFGGSFFFGLRAGHQHIDASTTINVAPYGSVAEGFSVDSWFLNPRVGFLWTSREGLALGIEAGVQFPIGTDVSSSVSLSLAPSAQSAANALGSAVIPTVDLLRVGLLL